MEGKTGSKSAVRETQLSSKEFLLNGLLIIQTANVSVMLSSHLIILVSRRSYIPGDRSSKGHGHTHHLSSLWGCCWSRREAYAKADVTDIKYWTLGALYTSPPGANFSRHIRFGRETELRKSERKREERGGGGTYRLTVASK